MKKVIRELECKDFMAIDTLDDQSGNYVSQWFVDDNYTEGYAFGLFIDDNLIGYCTIGGADCDVPDCITKHPAYTDDSLLLSDVYVLPEYRHQNLASELIKRALELKFELEGKQAVYLTLLSDSLEAFYRPLGFEWVDDTQEYAMVAA